MHVANDLTKLIKATEEKIAPTIKAINRIALFNQAKVLEAFQKNKINQGNFQTSTGYGYDDIAREGIEKVYTAVFKAEKALVRSQIVSGTHAISCCLFGLLRPSDWVISITGSPYDTLQPVIGHQNTFSGSLMDLGVLYDEIPLDSNLHPNKPEIAQRVRKLKPKMVLIQRSRGYQWRPSISIDEIQEMISLVKTVSPDTICFVDNCYGEFVETREPIEAGADLIAGSLIKNPGGGIAPTGGYIVGKENLVELATTRLTAPGINDKVGASLIDPRLLYQGFFMAPHIVKEALITAVYASAMFELLGYTTDPSPNMVRTDIIQAIKLDSQQKMTTVCKALQETSPVDSFITPEASEMAGYDKQVIMAGGTFVQGSSIELSADGPMTSPYILYLQGSLSSEHGKLAINHVINTLINSN